MKINLALPRRASALLLAVGLLLANMVAGIVVPEHAGAAQLTTRKVTIDKAKTSDTDVSHVFSYTVVTTGSAVQGIIYQFCTTPLGACTLPTGMSVQSATHDAQSGFPGNVTAFTAHTVTNEGDCDMLATSSKMCFERIEATTGGGAVTHTISNITAPSSQQTVYVRVSLYSNNTFVSGGKTDEGVVATAYSDQLTVTGRVQERLEFCLAAVDDADALPAAVSTCAALTDVGIDIGVIDNTAISIAPVTTTPTNGSDDDYGIAMVNTNASGGVVIAFYPEAAATGTEELRSFRVTGATCTAGGASLTDQCFVDAAGAGETFVAGTERFGVYVACIDTTQGTTSNLGSVPGAYNGSDNTTASAADCENEAATDFAWNDSATAATLASSSNVVDDEIVKLRFGATASATTPTGAYSVTTTYIATPTF